MRVAGEAGPEGLSPTTARFGVALSDIVRCRACGHMQLAQMPQLSLAEGYAESASSDYLGEQRGQRLTAGTLLETVERHVHPGALLDVGCWVGFLLDEARRRGWRTAGVEPSTFASSYARDQLGLQVQTSDLFSADLPPASFDAVVLSDVLEHLPGPGQALDRIAALTRPGGVLLLTLPDAGSRVAQAMGRRWWSVIPTHVQYFTRGSLTLLLARHGWGVLELGTAPKAFTIAYYLSRVGGYSTTLADSLVKLAGVVGAAERIWAPDFRDRIYVVARSPGSAG